MAIFLYITFSDFMHRLNKCTHLPPSRILTLPGSAQCGNPFPVGETHITNNMCFPGGTTKNT